MRREERMRKERQLLHELIMKGGLKEEVFEAWRRETRRQKSAFYDRLAELPEEVTACYESLTDRRKIDVDILKELIIYIEDSDEISKVQLKRDPDGASRLTKDELCQWWCEEFGSTAIGFEPYWRALSQEMKDLVAR